MRGATRTLLPALLCLALPLTACTTEADPGDASQGQVVLSGSGPKPKQQRAEDDSVRAGQTSEGIRGEIVAPYPEGLVPKPRVSKVRTYKMAPGVTYRRWSQTDRRGPIRAHLLRIDPQAPGVSLEYLSMPHVPQRDTVSGLVAREKVLAGVNGGFFDIHDTGAPLGVGVDPARGFLHASLKTWNNAFYLDGQGVPRIGKLRIDAQIDQFPQLEITNLNSPRVREGSIGIYSPDWGYTSGYSITDGQTRVVRQVVLKGGRVVANGTSLNRSRLIDGTVLVGRGPGAAALAQLRVGSLASASWSLPGAGRMAISGEKVLLRNGKRLVVNDRELHPRTAVGIDRDTGKVLLLVVDGRQRSSRGYTLVEMARLMRTLGAEDALNLDGGGSSTMVGNGRAGKRQVLNAPSDGGQRSVADGIGVRYVKPKG